MQVLHDDADDDNADTTNTTNTRKRPEYRKEYLEA